MSRVLLIEPDESLAAAIAKYLDKNGHHTVVCHDAQGAIAESDKTKPDIVVMELAIPKNNGLAFLQEFRSYTDWISIPAIVYSCISREDAGLTDSQWQKQGVEAYLYKPTKTLADLLTNIENIA